MISSYSDVTQLDQMLAANSKYQRIYLEHPNLHRERDILFIWNFSLTIFQLQYACQKYFILLCSLPCADNFRPIFIVRESSCMHYLCVCVCMNVFFFLACKKLKTSLKFMVQMPIAGRELSLHLLNGSDAHLHRNRKICSFSEMQWVRWVFSVANCTTFNFQLQVEMFALKFLCSFKCKYHLVVYPGIFWILYFIQCSTHKKIHVIHFTLGF